MELSLQGEKYALQQLNFRFEIFNPEKMEFQDFDKFVLRFHSPTFVRQENITYLLPNPDQIFSSLLQKMLPYCPIEIDEKEFKIWLKQTIYMGEFDLHSKLITIKEGKKA
ncbi:hypothetical protein IJM86_08405 [bacterium]|nr:hypothetical protein [bacterium]